MHALVIALLLERFWATLNAILLKWERLESELIELSIRILCVGYLEERFSAAGRAALWVTPPKASRN
jgi:hypothetical protein